MNNMTTNNNNRVPELRFPGFTGEWEEKKLGEIGTVIQGYGFPDKYQGQKKGDLPFCKVGDISAAVDRGKITINSAANYVNYSLLPTLHAQPIPVGSTIFAKIGEAIRSNKRIITGVPCLIDNNAAAIKAKDATCDNFMFYIMSQVNLANYSGGIVPSVNKSTIESINILLPPTLAEQQKIAECLSSLDEEIAAEAQKADALKDHKKGLMQQLFPQPGQTTPQRRFPGFTGEWVVKKLGEMAEKVNSRNRDKSETRVLTNSATEGVVDQNDYFDRDIAVKENTNNYHIVEINDFVYNPRISSSAPVGPISRNKIGKGIMSPLYTVFRFKSEDINFLEHFFNTTIWHKYLKSVANYGARFDRMAISTEDFYSMPILLPTLAEQQKIADCLSELDEMISAQQQKVEALKEHKKGLMQKLFPKM